MAAADHRARRRRGGRRDGELLARRREAAATADAVPWGAQPADGRTDRRRQGGEVSTEEWESKGKSTDHAVFKGCQVLRANADSDYPRGVYTLIIEDNRNDPHYKPKNSVPLGPGFTGWALPDKAEANLPAGCAARMDSTAPNITVTLTAPSKKGKSRRRTSSTGTPPRSATTRPWYRRPPPSSPRSTAAPPDRRLPVILVDTVPVPYFAGR